MSSVSGYTLILTFSGTQGVPAILFPAGSLWHGRRDALSVVQGVTRYPNPWQGHMAWLNLTLRYTQKITTLHIEWCSGEVK
jgi:hypothetical protein